MDGNTLLKPRNIKAHLKALALATLLVSSSFIGLELLLQVLDPWGIRFYDDMADFGTALENDNLRGYLLPDGVYEFSNWTATIADSARIVPNNPTSADCEIVVLGDSFTFAYGVSDAATWLNHISADFPEVRFLNLGVTAYTSANVLGTLQSFPDATGYIYISNDNDWELSLSPGDMTYENAAAVMPFIVRYGNYLYHRNVAQSVQVPQSASELLANPRFQRYFSDMQAISQTENLYIITWEDNFLGAGLDELGIVYVETPFLLGYGISIVDGHYNIEGNRVFAENLKPFFAEIIEQVCS